MNVRRYLDLAASVSRLKEDDRRYFHGAVGLRGDGVLVSACNGSPKEPVAKAHCEVRILRKLGKGGIIFLARTMADGTWGDTTPCPKCRASLRNYAVQELWYTTGPRSFASTGPMMWL